jgi:hypothetical protein
VEGDLGGKVQELRVPGFLRQKEFYSCPGFLHVPPFQFLGQGADNVLGDRLGKQGERKKEKGK